MGIAMQSKLGVAVGILLLLMGGGLLAWLSGGLVIDGDAPKEIGLVKAVAKLLGGKAQLKRVPFEGRTHVAKIDAASPSLSALTVDTDGFVLDLHGRRLIVDGSQVRSFGRDGRIHTPDDVVINISE
jgi:hypothetical protein